MRADAAWSSLKEGRGSPSIAPFVREVAELAPSVESKDDFDVVVINRIFHSLFLFKNLSLILTLDMSPFRFAEALSEYSSQLLLLYVPQNFASQSWKGRIHFI